jgi:hypothetical protein
VEARGKRFGGKERRSKAFVIAPSFRTVHRQKFTALGIAPVDGTARELLELISAPENLSTREEIIAQLHPGLVEILSDAGVTSHAQQDHLQQFLSAFQLIRQPERTPRVGKEFLLGAGPDWPDIYVKMDAHRDCEDTLLALYSTAPFITKTGGYAGGGLCGVRKEHCPDADRTPTREPRDAGPLFQPILFCRISSYRAKSHYVQRTSRHLPG